MPDLIGVGRTAEVFAYDAGRVLKLFFPGFPDLFVETELEIALILNQAPDLAPHCDGAVGRDNRRGIVYARVAGVQMATCIVAKPLALAAHALRLANVHLTIFQAGSLPLPAIEQRLTWSLDNARHLNPDERQALKTWLAGLPAGDAVLHGDLHPQNILVEGDRRSVIDWTNAARGNPLADVARTWVILRFGRAPEGTFSPLMLFISRWYMRLLAAAYERAMRKSLGYRRAELRQFKVVVAAARLAELGDDAEMRETRAWLRQRLGSMKVG